MSEYCNAYRLDEVVELYCLHQFNDRKKHAAKYLPMAKLVWEDLLQKTLWNNQAQWMPVKSGDPYPYIDMPKNVSRFLGVFKVDDCGQLVPLPTNNRINVVPKPPKNTCGCTAEGCSCGNLCSGMNTMTYETKEVVIDGSTYEERTWIQVAGNGDTIRWREIPTATYDEAGVMTVTTEKHMEVICKLEVHECGCVKETELNKALIEEKLGRCLGGCVSKIFNKQDMHGLEQYKFSDCGKKIYIVGAKATQYMVSFQRKTAADYTPVPHYCLDAMFSGIYMRSTVWNPTKHPLEKRESKTAYDNAKLDVIKFLHPINLEALARVSGERRQW